MAKEYTKKHIGKRTFEDVKKYVEWQSQGKCNVLSAKPEQHFDDLGVDVCVWNVKTDTDGDWWVVEGDGVPIALRLIGENAAAAGRENVYHWFLCKPALGGRDRQQPRPSAHPSATEQVLAGTSRSPFSASAGTKV